MKTKLILLIAILVPLGAFAVDNSVTDRSGTITTGGTAQTIAAANTNRRYFEFQNLSTETMYINFGATATSESNSFRILAGAEWIPMSNFCPTGSVSILAATTGGKFVAKEGG